MNRIGLLSLCLAVVLATGCREYRWYGYKTWSGDVLGGRLEVVSEPERERIHAKDGKRYADRKEDYILAFDFYVPYEYDLAGFLIKDIKMLGEESGTEINAPDAMDNDVREEPFPGNNSQDPPGWIVRATIAQSRVKILKHLPYEPYEMSFTLIAYGRDSSFQEETLSIRLETDFRKSRRNDMLSIFLSIFL